MGLRVYLGAGIFPDLHLGEIFLMIDGVDGILFTDGSHPSLIMAYPNKVYYYLLEFLICFIRPVYWYTSLVFTTTRLCYQLAV